MGVPFPCEDHCYCKAGEFGHRDYCRTHAEQRAITLARQGDGWRKLQGAKLIYVRLEADDSARLAEPSRSGEQRVLCDRPKETLIR